MSFFKPELFEAENSFSALIELLLSDPQAAKDLLDDLASHSKYNEESAGYFILGMLSMVHHMPQDTKLLYLQKLLEMNEDLFDKYSPSDFLGEKRIFGLGVYLC